MKHGAGVTAADGCNQCTCTDSGLAPLGFAFVTMASEWDASSAINALNGTVLNGRTIRVHEAGRERPGGGRPGGLTGGGPGGGRPRG